VCLKITGIFSGTFSEREVLAFTAQHNVQYKHNLYSIKPNSERPTQLNSTAR